MTGQQQRKETWHITSFMTSDSKRYNETPQNNISIRQIINPKLYLISTEEHPKKVRKEDIRFSWLEEGELNNLQEIAEKFKNYFYSIAKDTLRTVAYTTHQALTQPCQEPKPTGDPDTHTYKKSKKSEVLCGLDDIKSDQALCRRCFCTTSSSNDETKLSKLAFAHLL